VIIQSVASMRLLHIVYHIYFSGDMMCILVRMPQTREEVGIILREILLKNSPFWSVI
jgi:hypothetical protein